MAQWIFFDVGSTLVDEAAAYDHRVRDMISGTSITFQEFDNARIAFAKQGLDGNSAAIKHFGLTKTLWHPEDEVSYSDAHDTLAALCGKGYQLGIIANQSSGTAERLELWGLRKFFGVIAASAEIASDRYRSHFLWTKKSKSRDCSIRILEMNSNAVNCLPTSSMVQKINEGLSESTVLLL